jgi:hypothetical protein
MPVPRIGKEIKMTARNTSARKFLVRKTLTGALAALTFGGAIAASTLDASAGQRRHVRQHSNNFAGAAAIGIIGALAIGAIAASSARRNSHQSYGYGAYHDPYAQSHYSRSHQHYNSGYYQASGYPEVRCYKEKRPVHDEWGRFTGFQKVRVCH